MFSAVELSPPPGDAVNECHSQCLLLSSPARLLRLEPIVALVEPVHLIFGRLLFPAAFWFCQHYCLFERTLPSRSRATSVWSFLPPAMLQADFAPGPICLPFWWSRVRVDLSSGTMLVMNLFFFFWQPSSLSNSRIGMS